MEEIFHKNILYEIEIKVLTGMHIGGSGAGLKIGGSDNPVIMTYSEYNGKRVLIPYIPGSSLKGRMRSLLLTVYGVKKDREIVFPQSHDELNKM
ncbi:MAG: RAMP superfamily CRISPR-associated protein, partial [Thermoplasmatales archaeon]